MELNKAYEDNKLARLQEFLKITIDNGDIELRDSVDSFEEADLKNTWNYVFKKMKELAIGVGYYVDDGTMVLKFSKEYLMDYKNIKQKEEDERKAQEEELKAQQESVKKLQVEAKVKEELEAKQEKKQEQEERNLFSF